MDKVIRITDRVLVTEGRHFGRTGWVTNIYDDFVIIEANGWASDFRVPPEYCQKIRTK